jgi:hypothetical protein
VYSFPLDSKPFVKILENGVYTLSLKPLSSREIERDLDTNFLVERKSKCRSKDSVGIRRESVLLLRLRDTGFANDGINVTKLIIDFHNHMKQRYILNLRSSFFLSYVYQEDLAFSRRKQDLKVNRLAVFYIDHAFDNKTMH